MRSKTNTAPPTTIDEYLSRVSDDKRSALQRLRETILRVIPMAEECISYQMPAFRYDGRVLVYFAAAANHCAFYPGGMVKNFKDELDGYETSKGTIRFQPERPLPASLVHRIVKARLAQNAARASKAKQAKPKQAKPKRTKPKQAKANQAKPEADEADKKTEATEGKAGEVNSWPGAGWPGTGGATNAEPVSAVSARVLRECGARSKQIAPLAGRPNRRLGGAPPHPRGVCNRDSASANRFVAPGWQRSLQIGTDGRTYLL